MHITAFNISMSYGAHHKNMNEDKPVLISSEDVATAAYMLHHNLITVSLCGLLATAWIS